MGTMPACRLAKGKGKREGWIGGLMDEWMGEWNG
jgi:hypothetical protein